MIATALVGAGAYLHKIDSGAKATLAEASRISLESQERFRRIQATADALTAERREVEAANARRLQEIAERESRLREQTITVLESQARQAEQIRTVQREMEAERQRSAQFRDQAVAAQRRYEESLNRLAAAQRQQDEARRQQERMRLAVAEESARKSIQAVATAQVQPATPATIVWLKPLPTAMVKSVEHHRPKPPASPAAPLRPCTLHPGFQACGHAAGPLPSGLASDPLRHATGR